MGQHSNTRGERFNLSGLRAVLFDLDGTLYRQGPMRVLMALELATLSVKAPGKARRRLAALAAYRRAQEVLRQSSGADPATAQIRAASTASGLPEDEVTDLVTEWMIERPLKYLRFCRVPGVEELLERLVTAGLRTGVLSDYPAARKLEALGLHRHFPLVLCSTDTEIAAFKPSPRGYLRACEVWQLSPAEVLFVGDRPEVDAAGAKAAGMPCIIVGSSAREDASGSYSVVPSFERLSRVFDRN